MVGFACGSPITPVRFNSKECSRSHSSFPSALRCTSCGGNGRTENYQKRLRRVDSGCAPHDAETYCQASHLTVWLFNGASCRAIAAVTGSPCSRQMADAVIKGRSIHPLRARLVRRNSLVEMLRSMSPRVACRRHRYRLAIGVKEKAKKPSADGDGYGADEQKCAIYQRKHSAGKHRNIVPGMIKRNSTYLPQAHKHPSRALTKSTRNRTAKSTMTLRNRQ